MLRRSMQGRLTHVSSPRPVPDPTGTSDGSHDVTGAVLRDRAAEVVCIVVVRELRGAVRVEDTTAGWSDMPDQPAMDLGRP